jgi:hypothetical protein
VPEGLVWNETRPPTGAGAVVVFDGPGASATRAWVGLIAVFSAVLFGKLVFGHDDPWWVNAMPIALGGAGVSVIVQGVPGAHKGRIEVDAARMHVVPSSPFAIELEVPLVDVDYFSSDSETTGYQAKIAGGSRSLAEIRFRVYVYRRDGRRHTLAMFGEQSAAVFMAQRLEGLIERARAGRFSSRA